MPLRDLLRTGMPRSPKSRRMYGPSGPVGWAERRTRSGHGQRYGAQLVQSPPGPREWLGVMKPNIRKR
jgi:hypothetical protein